MSEKLKSAPKTKIIQVLKALQISAKLEEAFGLTYLCQFAINNYGDIIEQWNTAEDAEYRKWLVKQGEEQLFNAVNKDVVLRALKELKQTTPVSEVQTEVLYVLGVAVISNADVDLNDAYREQQRTNIARSAASIRSLDEVALVNRCMPGLCTNEIDRSLWMTDRSTGERRRLTSNELEFPDLVLAEEQGESITRNGAISAIRFLAQKNIFNPAAEMIRDCHQKAGARFTTTEASDKFLLNVAKVLYDCDDPVLQKGFAQALVCLVRSTFDPGSKPLMYCPTLVGPGGCAKSRSIACLIPEPFRKLLFKAITVSPNKLFGDLTQLSVAWLQEMPEVDRYIRGQFAEDFKSLMTAESNNFRAPYARVAEDHDRLAAFFGTSNKPTGILTDTTSSCDRRILPIQIKPGHRIPWQLLEEGMNIQIWAAAYQSYMYPKEFDYYLPELPYETYTDLSRVQTEFRESDPLQERLVWELSIRNTLNPAHFLEDCIDKPISDQKPEDIKRINGLMRTLHHEEWEQKSVRLIKGCNDRTRLWIRKDPLSFQDYTQALAAYKEAGVSHNPIQRVYSNQPDPRNFKTTEEVDF